jgi:hypothetical protein
LILSPQYQRRRRKRRRRRRRKMEMRKRRIRAMIRAVLLSLGWWIRGEELTFLKEKFMPCL